MRAGRGRGSNDLSHGPRRSGEDTASSTSFSVSFPHEQFPSSVERMIRSWCLRAAYACPHFVQIATVRSSIAGLSVGRFSPPWVRHHLITGQPPLRTSPTTFKYHLLLLTSQHRRRHVGEDPHPLRTVSSDDGSASPLVDRCNGCVRGNVPTSPPSGRDWLSTTGRPATVRPASDPGPRHNGGSRPVTDVTLTGAVTLTMTRKTSHARRVGGAGRRRDVHRRAEWGVVSGPDVPWWLRVTRSARRVDERWRSSDWR